MKRIETDRNKVDREIKLEVKWQYDQQPNPAFHRLMSLLLQQGNERKREVSDD